MASPTTSSTPSILVADDDAHFLRLMEYHLRSWGYRVVTAPDKPRLLQAAAENPGAILLLDVRLGEHDGVELLKPLLDREPSLKVVMMTAHGTIDGAVAALKLGAADYITKPIDLDRLRATINHVVDDVRVSKTEPERRDERATAPCPSRMGRPILGSSPQTLSMIAQIENVASVDVTVLVLGESGTGKELVARAIHDLSPRHAGPFIAINVAALPSELVESTLFGHEKGAFTGADKAQIGCCQAADGGTLFLDEIAEMEIGLQAKLLRFLQERKIQRVGRSESISVDVRIVAATNREPLDQVRLGKLREDLYYRLNVVPIRVPSLRARPEDITILAEHFLDTALARYRRPRKEFTLDALSTLRAYRWPGNVRQLENLIERLAILVPGPEITGEIIRYHLAQEHPTASLAEFSVSDSADGPSPRNVLDFDSELESGNLAEIDRIEMQAIIDSLGKAGGNVRDAAKRLGMGQATIYRKIKKYKISI